MSSQIRYPTSPSWRGHVRLIGAAWLAVLLAAPAAALAATAGGRNPPAGARPGAREAIAPSGVAPEGVMAREVEQQVVGVAAGAQVVQVEACRTRSGGCGEAPAVWIDLRDYIHQGPAGGQRESDPVHWHGEGLLQVFACRPEDCDDTCLARAAGEPAGFEDFFHKQYILDLTGDWLCPEGATPTVHNMKTPAGAPIEYACTDGDAISLVWETSPFLDCSVGLTGNILRLFLRPGGGALEEGALWTPVVARSGARVWSEIRETRFRCEGAGELTESDRGQSTAIIQILGPFDVSTPEGRARTLRSWRLRRLVPLDQPDEEALPRAWYEGFPADVGLPGAPVEIVVRSDSLNVRGDFRSRDLVENYFYGVIDRGGPAQLGTGLIRWNVGSLGERTIYRQGTVTRLVQEVGPERSFGKDLCEP